MGKYIIVTGGQFANKGAQAMTYIAADEIAKRWPNCKMLMYYNSSKQFNKDAYKFGFVSDQGHFLLHTRSYRSVLRDTEAIIDISGYALGSAWSERGNVFFVKNRLVDAKHYGIPVYLMSQSFGPFAYRGKLKRVVMFLLKRYLPYARIIMAREECGEKELKNTFSLSNVVLTPDLVLQNTGIDLSNVFTENHTVNCINLEGNKKVAIIPNKNNARYMSNEELLKLYHDIIEKLKSLGYTIFLVYHSEDDVEICKRIFESNISDGVKLLDKELDCLEFEKTVDQFEFVIASRYHSVVHAYRGHVPAIVLGWADKYRELMKSVQQDQYFFDLRNRIDERFLLDTVTTMSRCVGENSETIATQVSDIQKNNMFDMIKLKSELHSC